MTIVFDAMDDDDCTMGSDYAPFYTSGIRGKAMTYTNNWTSFVDYAEGSDFPNATATLGCGTNVDLPYTVINYYYEYDEATAEQTAEPEIVVTPGDDFYTFTAQVKEGDDPWAYVTLYMIDDEGNRIMVDNPFVVARTADNQDVELVAVAHIDGQKDGEFKGTYRVPAKTPTGINEVEGNKAITSVRYFNMVGQEVQEAEGLTVVVTTYSDGSTTAVKVMK